MKNRIMKKGLLILFILSSFNSKGTIHQIQVWSGYMQFLPSNNIIVQLGDTIQWTPLDPPTMSHTITSNNIPAGAVPFDQIWQMPADTFFQYIPQVAGLYQYVCTPHIPNGMIGEFTVINGSNLNCSDSLLITDVIIDNTNLTMNIAVYNGYNSILNYPHVAFTIDANGDTIQTGNMNLFVAFNYDTTWYNYSISSPSLFPTYPLTSYFVYTSSLTFMSDTCVLTYNSTPTAILYPSYNNEKEIIKITDILGRETKEKKNTPLFYIFDDGTVEKKIIIE
jgi:plastocyanin